MTYKLTPRAQEDIAQIGFDTMMERGWEQEIKYMDLLTAKMVHVGNNPDGVSSTDRDKIRKGYKTYPAEHYHLWYYIDGNDAIIVRVVRQEMDPWSIDL